MLRKHWLLVSAASLAIVAAACGGSDGDSAGADGATTVTTSDNQFEPTSISAQADGTIELINDGEAPHNFSIKGESVDVDVEPGAAAEVRLSGVDAGSYDVFCKLHEQAGMTATLQIEG